MNGISRKAILQNAEIREDKVNLDELEMSIWT